MNIFKFTKSRKWIFVILLLFPLVIQYIPDSAISIVIFFTGITLLNFIGGNLFDWTGCFSHTEFGLDANGWCGNIIVIIIYLVIIFFISWIGNIMKDE